MDQMTKPPTGYYRQLLSNSYPMVRIAFTHTPMTGVTRVDSNNVLNVLKESTDSHAQYYIKGLTEGSMVTIVENTERDRYFAVGELYFKS
jgi:hypothetical protein